MNPWYIPGSLQNLSPVAGKVPGFRFVYRLSAGKTFLYVIHRMILTVDGKDASADLRLKFKNVTVRSTELPTTNWVAGPGDPMEFTVSWPGGLAAGRHRIRAQAVFGGNYGGRSEQGLPRELFDFEMDLHHFDHFPDPQPG